MFKIYSFLFFWFVLCHLATAQQLPADSLQIMFVGDIMSHGPQLQAAYQASDKTYDYTENFKYVKTIFQQADFVVGNLETTLGVKPYSGYPQFSAPPALAKACRDAGINVLATANNHSCDKRRQGIVKTLDILDSLQILHTGTYRNQKEKQEKNALIIKKNGIKLALLNYTYGTNGIPVPKPVKVNLIDTTSIKQDIHNVRLQHPDGIIVFLHWGEQYQNHPSKSQTKLVDFLHRQGIHWIIGSHPHVIQGIDYEQDYLNQQTYFTVYSLGNFISNQRKFPRDGSMILSLQFAKNAHSGKLQLAGYQTLPVWVYKFTKKGKRHYEILPVETFKYRPDYFIKNTDYQKMMHYYKHYKNLISD